MSSWLRSLRADARVRLFCLPYAGGGVAEFVRWRLVLPADIDVAPISLPGRDVRLAEPPHRRLAPLVDAIVAGIGPAVDRPWALYGHSMGAAVGFAVASALVAAGKPPPVHLFLGARGPAAPALPPLRDLSDARFVEAVQARYQAIPAQVAADRELMALFLPALRADMEIAETASLDGLAPVPAPATALVGADDPTVSAADAARWAPLVGQPFAVRALAGGHFFLKGPNRDLLAYVAEKVRG